jgi:glucose/arabinose dehydrogenase
VNIAPAEGWPAAAKPVSAPGTVVSAFAADLDHPRWIYVLPNGDVLVAETNAPPNPDGNGIKGWITKWVMKDTGAEVPTANRITLLRDADGDGIAETKSAFLVGLNSPFGMALIGNDLFVANTDAVMRFPYTTGEMRITEPGTKVVDLPAGRPNYH